MPSYTFPVTIEARDLQTAQQILSERIEHEEDLGVGEYRIEAGYEAGRLDEEEDER